MSAPAGWHLQPDGQERYWDGSQWTDQFRAPLPSDPTAPPPTPSWAASVDEIQALDVERTQAIPPADPEQPAWPGYQAPQEPGYPHTGYAQAEYAPAAHPQAGYPQQGYQQAPYPQEGYQQAPYPQAGYGAPGSPAYGPPPRQSSGLAKGCLIAAIIGVLVLGAAAVGGIYVFNRAADTISDTFPSGFPTELPSDFPSDGSTDGQGKAIDISVGDGFELPRATIDSGWSLDAEADASVVTINGMKATLSSEDSFPVLFTMSFPAASGAKVVTVCTASGSSGDTVDVSCVPLFGDVADATRATVTSSL